MNNLFNTTSGSSPGFVYFATEQEPAKPEKAEGQDYIAFGDNEESSKFSPRNYSSPQSGRNRYHQDNGSPRYHHNNSRGGRFRQNRFSNQRNSPFSPNNSRNSSYGGGQNFGRNDSFSRNAFMHPSFVEDPWAGLQPIRIQKPGQEDDYDEDDESGNSN